MTAENTALTEQLQQIFGDALIAVVVDRNEVTIEVPAGEWRAVAKQLHDAPALQFTMMIDVCGIDYAHYGQTEWQTQSVTSKGFSRGVHAGITVTEPPAHQLAVVYHLLSVHHNRRLRVRVWAEGEPPIVPSVVEIWNGANWFEREAFDLFGILFDGHPDLRRILTDYGFVGYPFRKDFPLVGQVEMRYDATAGRCVYEPVSIEPRTLVPRVIRDDNRYADAKSAQGEG